MNGVVTVLTIIFVVLKLTGVIAWSWWWVLSPTLIGLGIAVGLLAFVGVIATVAAAKATKKR